MRVAIHQPNFIPWFPFFYKMASCDKFVLLEQVQFEKNNYQNRFMYKDKWITKPVINGNCRINDKDYVSLKDDKYWNGRSLKNLNVKWIECIKDTIDIKTEIVDDYIHNMEGLSFDTPTHRLLSLIKWHKGDVYVTNPEAKNKYLDEQLLKDNGIEIEYCVVPRHLRKSTFEILEEYGVEGAIKQLPKRKHAELEAVL